MKNFSLILLSLWLLFSACYDKRTDTEIQLDITKAFTGNEAAANVVSNVRNGFVVLTGTCKTDSCIRDCEEKVRAIAGVQGVRNELQRAAVPGASSPNKVSGNPILQAALKEIMEAYPELSYEMTANRLILKGEIQIEEFRLLMGKLKNLQIEEIDNQLTIR